MSRLCKTCSNSFTFTPFDDIIIMCVNFKKQEVRVLSNKQYNNNNNPKKQNDDIDAFFAEFDNPAITGKGDAAEENIASRSSASRSGKNRRSSSAKSKKDKISAVKTAAEKKADKLKS